MPVTIKTASQEVFCTLPSRSVSGRYELVRDRSSSAEGSVEAIGGGGFGVVVLARDQIGILRAIKLLDPTKTAAYGTSDLFAHEIRLTNSVPFKHVVPIIDYGRLRDVHGVEYGYYVFNYVPGRTLQEYVREIVADVAVRPRGSELKRRAHDEALQLVGDVFAALVELENARVLHMDLKPQNVLVHSPPESGTRVDRHAPSYPTASPRNRAFVIDLGGGKPLTGAPPRERTPLVCTRYWFPSHLLSELGFSKQDQCIDYGALRAYGTTIDLYCLGRILEYMFTDRVRREARGVSANVSLQAAERAKQRFWAWVFDDDFEVIEGIVGRLLQQPVTSYTSAAAAAADWKAIQLDSEVGILASRGLTNRHFGIRIRVGQALVRVSPSHAELVEHPMFQRLRRMQQLTFVSEVFPEGTHTRLAHSLLAYDMAKKFTLGLSRKSAFRLVIRRRDVNLLLCSALLKDIGQYPFSHAIEDLKKLSDLSGASTPSQVLHDQECARWALDVADDHGVTLNDVLARLRVDPDELLYVISKGDREHDRRPGVNLVRDLVNGLIDADKATYLIQDSSRTGMSYGAAVDVDSLVEALTLRYEQSPDGDQLVGLGLEEAGVGAAEAILAGVHWMYRHVYWRHSNRAFMTAVRYVFDKLLRAGTFSFAGYWDQASTLTDWEALRLLREEYDVLIAQDGSLGVNPLADIADMKRLGYARVWTLGRANGSARGGLYERFVQGATPERLNRLSAAIGDALGPSVSAKEGEVLVDVPLKQRFTRASHRAGTGETIGNKVWVCRRSVATKEVIGWTDFVEYSALGGLISSIDDHSGRKIRVFLGRNLLGRAGSSGLAELEARVSATVQSEVDAWN